MRCKKRRCPSCGILWAGDTRQRILGNLIDGYGGRLMLLTITAPGDDVLPREGDEVRREAAQAWNQAMPGQWSAMNRRLRIAMQRAGLPRPTLLGYVDAYQRRGVLHMHVVFGAQRPVEAYAARRYVQALKRHGQGGKAYEYCNGRGQSRRLECGWAQAWGFGFVDLVEARGGARGLASYLAKYVCKEGASGQPELAETVAHEDVPKRPVYISPRLTRTTRCTMRNLRLRRYYWRAETMRQPGAAECWYVEDVWERGGRVEAGRLVIPRGP